MLFAHRGWAVVPGSPGWEHGCVLTCELATERLFLRAIQVTDAPALAAIYADPDVSRFLRSLDQNGTRAQVARFVHEWEERRVGIFAVLERSTGDFIGRSGLHYWPQFDETEVGWVLRRTDGGKASRQKPARPASGGASRSGFP